MQNEMPSINKVENALIQTGCFKDFLRPVILTSGELGVYYINSAGLLQDDGEYEDYGDSSMDMISHAFKCLGKSMPYRDAIDRLSHEAINMAYGTGNVPPVDFISGGQRRDWLFSGPVAYNLSLPHISLYKNGSAELFNPAYNEKPQQLNRSDLEGKRVMHIVDMLTKGSSCYNISSEQKSGWIPFLRNLGGEVSELMSLITRKQGGEEMLQEKGVTTYPLVAIDEPFLRAHSTQPETAVSYLRDPVGWTKQYIRQKGATELTDYFDKNRGKIDRARKFVNNYQDTLRENGRMEELDNAVREKFGYGIDDIVK